MNEEPILPEASTQESQDKKNKRDFWKGFWISIICNVFVVLFLLAYGVSLTICGALLFLANLLIMIYLYFKNQKAFKGMVAGFALGFLIMVIAGVFLVAICFSIYLSS